MGYKRGFPESVNMTGKMEHDTDIALSYIEQYSKLNKKLTYKVIKDNDYLQITMYTTLDKQRHLWLSDKILAKQADLRLYLEMEIDAIAKELGIEKENPVEIPQQFITAHAKEAQRRNEMSEIESLKKDNMG